MPTEMAVSGTVTGTLGAAVETTVLGTAGTATFDTTVETTVLGTAGTATFGTAAGRACLTSRRAPTRFCNTGESLPANNRCRSAVVSEFNSS